MSLRIRDFAAEDLASIVRLSLRAWEPNFVSTREVLGPDIDAALHPNWRAFQQASVEAVCTDPTMHVSVAEVDADLAGFVAVNLHDDGRIGEVVMLAVDPEHQGRGVGTELTEFALLWIKDAGAPVAMIGTGGDRGHAPARRTYEKAGLTLLPLARYFKKL